MRSTVLGLHSVSNYPVYNIVSYLGVSAIDWNEYDIVIRRGTAGNINLLKNKKD